MIFSLTPDWRSESVVVACSPMSGCGLQTQEFSGLCDYSLQSMMSRPAKVGDRFTTRNFGTGTRGFAAPENSRMAVCVLPGTELAFSNEVKIPAVGFLAWRGQTIGHATAIFRQIRKNEPRVHHDASGRADCSPDNAM
jgi:hypothetical protein